MHHATDHLVVVPDVRRSGCRRLLESQCSWPCCNTTGGCAVMSKLFRSGLTKGAAALTMAKPAARASLVLAWILKCEEFSRRKVGAAP